MFSISGMMQARNNGGSASDIFQTGANIALKQCVYINSIIINCVSSEINHLYFL